MKCFTARCTMAVAVAAWLGLPLAAWSQTPPSTPAPTAQKPSAPAGEQQGAGLEHITQAKAALNDIPATIPARAKTRIAELKRHLNALEKSASASTPPAAKKGATQATANWATDVAAIDKILTELLGPAGTGATGQPTGATGTAGTAAATKSGSAAALALDETTKTKLMEVRTHVTAFAAAMSGSGARAPDAAASQPSAADPAAAAAAQPPTTTPAEPSTPPASPTSPAQNPASMPAQNPPAAAEQAQQPGAGAQADPEASKRHLTAARDSLSQLTQLPAAAQLTGEARTQVSQLITNFNELISTKENWRASYDKVEANLTAILGPEGTAAAAPATGTPGAVGTAGTMAATLDPAVRAKLVEFRSHLTEFQKAMGGGSSGSTATPTGDPASTPPTAGSAAPTAGSAAPASSSAPSTPAEQTPAAQQPSSATGAMGQTSAISHIDAIEAILNGRSPAASSQTTAGATTGAAGTTGSGPASLTLDRSQVEQIRMHLAELRKAVDKK